jgi:hypothetical protein
MAIPKTEDPALTELERIVTTELQAPCSFVYANLFEANFGLDELKDVAFPVFVYFADDKSKYRVTEYGMQTRALPIVGMMLTMRNDSTVDYASKDVNPEINLTRQMVENLIYHLNKSPLSIWENKEEKGGVDNFETENIYQKFDAHLFGQGVSFQWKVKTTMGAYQ